MLLNEIKRKLFHLLSLPYALAYYFLGKELVVKILSVILILEAMVEFGRFYSPKLLAKLLDLFGGIHRPEEVRRLTGIFWTLLGSILTMALFKDARVVLCAMGYLIFGDLAAALVGVQFGRHRFFNKSVEGSSAFFVVCFAVGLFFFDPWMAAAGALLATFVEALPLPVNDNLTVPVFSALFLTALS